MKFSCTAMASRFVALLVLALVMGTTTVAVGQVTSGSITGTVKDTTGGVIPQATVTVASPSTGVTRTVTTNDTGDFVVPNLPPGDYTIRIESGGFKALEKSDVHLSATDRLNAASSSWSWAAPRKSSASRPAQASCSCRPTRVSARI